MGWNRPDEDYRADHERDYRKHDTDPLPIRLEPAPITGALEVAILAQAVSLTKAADLIERYAQCVAAGARLDAVSQTIDKCCAEIEKYGETV